MIITHDTVHNNYDCSPASKGTHVGYTTKNSQTSGYYLDKPRVYHEARIELRLDLWCCRAVFVRAFECFIAARGVGTSGQAIIRMSRT